jgi:hypothetical protein
MMSCTTSVAWSRPVSSPCCTEHGHRRGAVLSGRITTVAMSRSGQLSRHCIIEPNCSGLSARFAGASVTRESALKTCEPSYVPGAARPFFIPMAHGPLGAVEYVRAPKLSYQGGRVWSHRTRRSVRAHLDKETRSRAEEHVTAPELNSARRRGPGPRNTWQHQSLPRQGGEVQGYRTRESTEAYLDRKERSGAT